jgi:predicted RNA methylase
MVLDALPLASSRFIDLGSGMGRTPLVASERPFERIVGVELMPELHRIAQRNVEVYRSPAQACKNIDVHCMSATEFDFGTEPLVLFMLNRFAKDTLASVLERLEASLPEVYVANVHPVFHDVSRSSGVRDLPRDARTKVLARCLSNRNDVHDQR